MPKKPENETPEQAALRRSKAAEYAQTYRWKQKQKKDAHDLRIRQLNHHPPRAPRYYSTLESPLVTRKNKLVTFFDVDAQGNTIMKSRVQGGNSSVHPSKNLQPVRRTEATITSATDQSSSTQAPTQQNPLAQENSAPDSSGSSSDSDSDSSSSTDSTESNDSSSTTKERNSTPTRESSPIVDESTRRFASAPIGGITTIESNNMSRRNGRSNAAEITVRLTENSRLYISEFLDTHKDTKAFDNCKTLTGADNFNDWIREFSIASRKVGFLALFNGQDTAPEALDDDAPIDKWNEYMLEKAAWLGRNESLLGHIQANVAPHIHTKIVDCTLVSEALEIIDNECTSKGADLTMSHLVKLVGYSFDEAATFLDFQIEFDKRFNEFNRLRGNVVLSDDMKCILFMIALGPRFKSWVTTTTQNSKVAGCGRPGQEIINFDTLSSNAQNHWESVIRDNDSALVPSENRSFAAGFRQGQKRQFDQRASNMPPFGKLVGQPNVKCQWPGHGEANHTNNECFKQNTERYNEMQAKKRAKLGGTGSNQTPVHPQRQAYVTGAGNFGAASDAEMNQSNRSSTVQINTDSNFCGGQVTFADQQ